MKSMSSSDFKGRVEFGPLCAWVAIEQPLWASVALLIFQVTNLQKEKYLHIRGCIHELQDQGLQGEVFQTPSLKRKGDTLFFAHIFPLLQCQELGGRRKVLIQTLLAFARLFSSKPEHQLYIFALLSFSHSWHSNCATLPV